MTPPFPSARARKSRRLLRVLPGIVLASVVAAARTQMPHEPTWPQPFQVVQGESTSFGFLVTQPGPITVDVTSQGAPISVTLSGPLAQSIARAGTGSITIAYSATPTDVQRAWSGWSASEP